MGWWNWEGWPRADEWTAWWAAVGLIPALVGAVAAITAAWIAIKQLREVVRSNDALTEANEANSVSNLSVSRPYVTVDLDLLRRETMKPGPLQGTMRIVIRNDGASPALNVRLTAEPPFQAKHLNFVEGGIERHHAVLAETFSGEVAYPMMRPGRTYSLTLDDAVAAVQDASLPSSYKVTAAYSTIDGLHEFEETYDLVPGVLAPLLVEADGLTRISKDLQRIATQLEKRGPRKA